MCTSTSLTPSCNTFLATKHTTLANFIQVVTTMASIRSPAETPMNTADDFDLSDIEDGIYDTLTDMDIDSPPTQYTDTNTKPTHARTKVSGLTRPKSALSSESAPSSSKPVSKSANSSSKPSSNSSPHFSRPSSKSSPRSSICSSESTYSSSVTPRSRSTTSYLTIPLPTFSSASLLPPTPICSVSHTRSSIPRPLHPASTSSAFTSTFTSTRTRASPSAHPTFPSHPLPSLFSSATLTAGLHSIITELSQLKQRKHFHLGKAQTFLTAFTEHQYPAFTRVHLSIGYFPDLPLDIQSSINQAYSGCSETVCKALHQYHAREAEKLGSEIQCLMAKVLEAWGEDKATIQKIESDSAKLALLNTHNRRKREHTNTNTHPYARRTDTRPYTNKRSRSGR